MHTKNKSATILSRALIIVMALMFSLAFLSTPSFAEDTSNVTGTGPDVDITDQGDSGQDKVDGDTIGGGGSHTAAGTGESVKGDEGFRLYLIDEDGAVVSKVVDFYYPDVPHIPFMEMTGSWKTADYEWDPDLFDDKSSVGAKDKTGYRTQFKNIGEYACFNGMPHITFSPSGGPAGGSEIEAWSHEKDERGVENINHVVAQIFDSDSYSGGLAPGSLKAGLHEYKRFMAGEYQLVMEGLWWYVPGANVMRDGTWQSKLVELKHPVSIC